MNQKVRQQVLVEGILHFPSITKLRTYSAQNGGSGAQKNEAMLIMDEQQAGLAWQAITAVMQQAYGGMQVEHPLHSSAERREGFVNGFTQGSYWVVGRWTPGREPQFLWLDHASNVATEVTMADPAMLDRLFYAGARVRMMLDLYSNPNSGHGRRVNCGVSAIVWLGDGTPLEVGMGGGQPLSADQLGVGQVAHAAPQPAQPQQPATPYPGSGVGAMPQPQPQPGAPAPMPGQQQGGMPAMPAMPGQQQGGMPAMPGQGQPSGMPGQQPQPGGYPPPQTQPQAMPPAMPGQSQPAPPLPMGG